MSIAHSRDVNTTVILYWEIDTIQPTIFPRPLGRQNFGMTSIGLSRDVRTKRSQFGQNRTWFILSPILSVFDVQLASWGYHALISDPVILGTSRGTSESDVLGMSESDIIFSCCRDITGMSCFRAFIRRCSKPWCPYDSTWSRTDFICPCFVLLFKSCIKTIWWRYNEIAIDAKCNCNVIFNYFDHRAALPSCQW